MILRDFHEILQKFQSLDEADIVDNKIGNQEEGQEDQLAEELVVTEDVRAAQLEEELLQRTEECDEIDVVEEHLDEDLDGGELLVEDLESGELLGEDLDAGEHLEVTEHPSDSGRSDVNKHREEILQMEEKKADEKEREGEQDLNKYEDELKEEREIEADKTKPTIEGSKNEKSRENEERARKDEIESKATKENENGEKDSLCDQMGEEVKPSKSGWTSPHAHLEQMFKNQEELERAVDQTSKATEDSSKKAVRADKKVTMQQVIRAFSAVRNLKKICRSKSIILCFC